MALSSSTRHSSFLISTMICIFLSTCKFGGANDEYYPHEPGPGVVGTNPGLVFTKALECFDGRNIYSSCEEAYRLTQNGELNVPVEYADEFCDGACLKETHLVLECIEEVLKNEFVFYNKATVEDVKETIETACSYGPKRGVPILSFGA